MPNLVDVPEQAETILESFGLKIGPAYLNHRSLRNTVLDQLYKGSSVHPGKKFAKALWLTLCVGTAWEIRKYLYPVEQLTQACLFEGSSLTIGTVHVDRVRDSTTATVYKQSPEPLKMTTMIRGGNGGCLPALRSILHSYEDPFSSCINARLHSSHKYISVFILSC